MTKKLLILILLSQISSCKSFNKKEDNTIIRETVIGSWCPISENFKSNEYEELFFSDNYVYIFKDAGLTKIINYKVVDRNINYIDNGVIIGNDTFSISNNNQQLVIYDNVSDSINAIYIRIKSGFTTEDYVLGNLKEEYWASFLIRQKEFYKQKNGS